MFVSRNADVLLTLGLPLLALLASCTGTAIPEIIDADGDGHPALSAGGADCDDTDPATFPGAEDVWYDGIDSNCDEADDFDQDGDGSGPPEYQGGDCDDTDERVRAVEGWESVTPCECTNGLLEIGENCDDGNGIAGDSCNPDCFGPCGDGVLADDESCLTESWRRNGVAATTMSGDIHTADLNGDGHLDMIHINHGLIVRLGDGRGHFVSDEQSFDYTGGNDSRVVDLDSDGDLDLVFARDLTTIAIHRNNGDGTFLLAVDIPSVSSSPLAVGDVNGDGRPDILSGGPSMVHTHLQQVDGSFLRIEREVGDAVRSLEVDDFDYDGAPEMVLGLDGALVMVEFDFTESVEIAPSFGWLWRADVDGDGTTDLISNGAGTDAVVYQATPDGWVTHPLPTTPALNGFWVPEGTSKDADGDGDIDLVFSTRRSSPGVLYYLNEGPGIWEPRVWQAPAAEGLSGEVDAVGDFDGNGTADVVMSFTENGNFSTRLLLTHP